MSKKMIEELVDQCSKLGWKVEETGRNLYKIFPPNGNPIISPGTANGRALANFKAELKAAGFNPEGAAAAKTLRASEAIAADRRKNDAALALAAQRAAQRETEAAAQPVQTEIILPGPTTLANPFAAPTVRPVTGQGPVEVLGLDPKKILAGYPSVDVRVTQAQAQAWLVHAEEELKKEDGCRQRPLYSSNWMKHQQSMELGEWELNTADSIVFCREHKSLVNGRHRMKALSMADSEFINEWYPEGLPFRIATDFPCHMSHIFDTGKARSASDALTHEGLQGWGPLPASALRLALNYDQSFLPGGVVSWPQWRRVPHSNTELVAAAAGPYAGLLEGSKLVSRAYTRSNVTRSATMVARFVIERDNPGGNPGGGRAPARTNEQFWKGVCGDADLETGDPRMAIIRVAMRTGSKYKADNGVTMLAHLMRGYAYYMLGSNRTMPQLDSTLPMMPVWQPGMKLYGKELRFHKYVQIPD